MESLSIDLVIQIRKTPRPISYSIFIFHKINLAVPPFYVMIMHYDRASLIRSMAC